MERQRNGYFIRKGKHSTILGESQKKKLYKIRGSTEKLDRASQGTELEAVLCLVGRNSRCD